MPLGLFTMREKVTLCLGVLVGKYISIPCIRQDWQVILDFSMLAIGEVVGLILIQHDTKSYAQASIIIVS